MRLEERSRPELSLKRDGAILQGRMALFYTGSDHDTPGVVDQKRDYDLIAQASRVAAEAVEHNDFDQLAEAVNISYQVQIKEGMKPLPEVSGASARKYCGGGFGGYAVYLFSDPSQREQFVTDNKAARPIEPYLHPIL